MPYSPGSLICALNYGPAAKLLLYSENRVLRRLGDSEFDDGLGWNPDLLLRLGIESRPRFSFLFHQLLKAWQYEFAVLFDLFVCQRAECIEKRSSRLLVCLSGLGECNLKFCFRHLSRALSQLVSALRLCFSEQTVEIE